MRLSARNKVRLLSYTAAAMLALFGWGLYATNLSRSYKMRIENDYASAMTDFSNYLTGIGDTLEKELYAGTSPQLSRLSAELSKDAAGAKHALNRLPVSSENTDEIYKFLSQVGEYSQAVAVKASDKAGVSDKEREAMVQLKKYADNLAAKISDIEASADGEYWSAEIKAMLESADSGLNLSALYKSVSDISQTDTSYPTLIYDGPFSDHLDTQKPLCLEGKAEVDRRAALDCAARFLGCNASELTDEADENSKVAAYVFSRDGDIAAVTKQGGYCMYMNKARVVEEGKADVSEAVKAAKEYLAEKIGGDFTESYYMVNEGVCVVNFAYTLDGVICYSDLIKVGVALDNCEVVSLEARGYIMNHRDRDKPEFKCTVEQAQKILSPFLKVKKANKAIVNSDGMTEYACYEFVCKGIDDEDILVYVNADTLAEQNILILLKTDGGEMTR